MTFLPEPWHLYALGGTLLVSSGLVLWLLKAVKIAAYLAVAGGACLLAGGVAGTYEARGKAIVQAKFDAYRAEQKQVVADTTVRWAAAVEKADEGAQARLAATKEQNDALEAKVSTLEHRSVVLSDALSDVLQHAGAGPAAVDTGPQTGGKNAAVAIPASATPQAYDEFELGQFFAGARRAYDSARNAWQACVDQYDGVRLGVQPMKGNT